MLLSKSLIQIDVTEDNRAEYVNRYTDWLLNKCIKVSTF